MIAKNKKKMSTHGLTCLKRQIDVYLFVESLHSHFATCKFFINENVFSNFTAVLGQYNTSYYLVLFIHKILTNKFLKNLMTNFI